MLGDEKRYIRMLHQFKKAHDQDMFKVNEYLKEGDVNEARNIVHTLKGVVGTMGLTRLQENVNKLWDELHSEENKGNYSELVDAVSAEQQNFHEALDHLAAQKKVEVVIDSNPEEAEKILHRLKVLLETGDATVNDLLIESHGLLQHTFGKEIDLLEHQIEAYNYMEALEALESIISNLEKEDPEKDLN